MDLQMIQPLRLILQRRDDFVGAAQINIRHVTPAFDWQRMGKDVKSKA